jgi:hypothetical protein
MRDSRTYKTQAQVREDNILEELRFVQGHVDESLCSCWRTTPRGGDIRRADMVYLLKYAGKTRDRRLWYLLQELANDGFME